MSFEERQGEMVRHCFHNYMLCPTQISRQDGSGWYIINRPDSSLLKLMPLFDELNAFLESIPLLGAYALRAGRAALRKAEASFDELLSA
jgi:hypothetical protein